MNLTGKKECIESETIYPIIQSKKSIRNKILDNNGAHTMKSLKNKTIFNYFNNKPKKSQKNNQTNAKSLKVIHKENKCFKTRQSIDKKTNNLFKKNNLRHSVNMKNSKISSNYTFFTFYDDIKNNRNEMNDILNQLLKIKQKINAINTIKNTKLKNISRSRKSVNEDVVGKEKSIDKTKKTKYKLKLLNNKIDNFENTNKDENKLNNYKTDINNYNIRNIKNEITKNNDLPSNKKQKYKLRLSFDKINKDKYSEKSETTNSSIKDISKFIDKNSISNNYNNIRCEKTEQINYIDKIRNDEFLDLYNKFKKSMKKSKKEEICHRKSLVFPAETVDYIIKKKNEFIIDKFRNEYLKRFDNYKFNNQKILKVIKNCNQRELKNIENSEINIDKSNIKKVYNDDAKENDKNNDTDSSSDNVKDAFNFYF